MVLIIDTAHTSALIHGTYTPIIKQACDLPRQLTITRSVLCSVKFVDNWTDYLDIQICRGEFGSASHSLNKHDISGVGLCCPWCA